MSHWTVEQGPVLVWDDRVLPIPLTWPDGEAAYDALVECVRKADKHDRQKHSKPEPREVWFYDYQDPAWRTLPEFGGTPT